MRARPTTFWHLVLTSLVPLAGVLVLGWDVWALLAIFWLENVVIGVFNVPRLWLARGPITAGNGLLTLQVPDLPRLLRVVMVPFFVLHYGMFTAVHGFFVLVILPTSIGASGVSGADALSALVVPPMVLLAAAVPIAVAESIDLREWLRAGGPARTSSVHQMSAPYRRVVLLHVVILFGGIAIAMLHSPLPLLIALVVAKGGGELWTARRRAASATYSEAAIGAGPGP